MSSGSNDDPGRPRRSSRNVMLVLIGTAALAGCGGNDSAEIRRDVYASLEDCRADWDRADLCEAAPATGSSTGTTSSGGGRSTYFGPRYYNDRAFVSDRPRPGSRAMSTTGVSRGGFGASGRSFSSGS